MTRPLPAPPEPRSTHRKTLLAMVAMCAGIAIFSVQDLILKLLSDRYPLSQAMVFRSLTAIPFMLGLVWLFDRRFGTLITRGWPAMAARGILNFLAYTAYYLALAALPIATTVALFFTAPLVITLLAVLVLKEQVSWRRWLGVFCGFVGVVLMVRPGTALFDWAALLPILCGAAYAVTMIMARKMGQRDTPAAMAFWGNLAFLFSATLLSAYYGTGAHAADAHPSLAFLTRGWAMPTVTDFLLMAACGGIAAIGLTLLTQAYAMAQSAVVAPFEYSFAFWGVLWGWLFFDTLPDAVGWLGIAVIVLSGLYVLHREGVEGGR